MAARFVVGLALLALSHSSPVLKNGIEEIRDGRSLSTANGFASGYGPGVNKATANVHGKYAHSTGSSSGAGLARDGLYHPGQGQAIANAHTDDNGAPSAVDIARAQGFYYPLPVAQPAVITYNQNFVPAEQLVYQPAGPNTAQSVATTNGALESSQSTATNNGLGSSESNAQTSGNYGQTTTNTKSTGIYNSASSNANNHLGVASVSSKAVGSGSGNGYASSNAQNNGIVPVAPIVPILSEENIDPAIIAAKNQGFYTPARFGSASSNANVNQFGSASSSAKAGPARRSISWRFGTAYDIPAGYGAIKSAAPVAYQVPIAYQAAPVVYETVVPSQLSPSNVKASVSTNGLGFAQSNANGNAGYSSTRSTANSNVGGNANANADVNNGYSIYRSAGLGSGLKSTANTNGLATAGSNADWNHGFGVAKSEVNSYGGNGNANADIANRGYGLYRSGEGAQWGRTISKVNSVGYGTAQANAQGFPSGQKTADSTATSKGWGYSSANSQSL